MLRLLLHLSEEKNAATDIQFIYSYFQSFKCTVIIKYFIIVYLILTNKFLLKN